MLVPAKINLRLKVGKKLISGKHYILTLMYKVPIYDRLLIKPNNKNRNRLFCNKLIKDNLIIQAIEKYKEYSGKNHTFDIFLKKHIPIGGGLGGGSMNAAYTLLFLNNFYNKKLNFNQLNALARGLGSDVSFGLTKSNSAVGVFYGNYIKPVSLFSLKGQKMYLAILYGLEAQDTAEIYKMYSLNRGYDNRFDIENELQVIKDMIVSYGSTDYIKFLQYIKNDFHHLLIKKREDIRELLEFANRIQGVYYSTISGTGSSCLFFIRKNSKIILNFKTMLEKKFLFKRAFRRSHLVFFQI